MVFTTYKKCSKSTEYLLKLCLLIPTVNLTFSCAAVQLTNVYIIIVIIITLFKYNYSCNCHGNFINTITIITPIEKLN